MPRVVFLMTSLATGGVLSAVRNMLRPLEARGVDCEVWALGRAEPGAAELVPAPTRVLGLPLHLRHRNTARALAAALAQAAPDVLHLQCYRVHVHGVPAARAAGIPWTLVSFHDLRFSLHRAAICRRLAGGVDRVLVVNQTMRRVYQQKCRYPDEKLVVMPNAVDTERFAPRERDAALAAELGLRPEHCVLGSVARLSAVKGYRYLVEALARLRGSLPQARLLLLGDGPQREYLQRLAHRRGVGEQVLFAGLQHDIPRWLSVMDLYVQPSLIESQPIAVLEAMASGVPVLATAVGGLPELLRDGELGRLVPARRPGELAAAIGDSARNRPAAADRARRARAVCEEEYSPAAYDRRLGGFYEELLAQTPASR